MNHYKEVKKPNRLWGKILLFFVSLYLNWKIDLNVSKNDTKDLIPPYLVLSNHVTYWDPFLVNMFVGEPICYIAEAIYFRNPLFRFILNSVGAIPKKRYMKQFLPVKRLLQAKGNGRILAFFPEGERKWDGTTDLGSLNATAKLVKLLGVPVVTVNIKGGYLAYPRWAKMSRKGRVDLNYNLCLSKYECREMSLEKIRNRIRDYLSYDEVNYQRKECNKYTGRKLAENVEHLLFICPNCKSIDTLISHGNKLICQKCQYGVLYNQYGFLEGIQSKLYFDNLRDWNYWQKDFLVEYINEKYISAQNLEYILKDKEVSIFVGNFNHPFIYKGEGNLFLQKRELHFEDIKGGRYSFELREIIGLSVQFKAVLEFNYRENMYRFEFHNPHLSAYKWALAINFTREKIEGQKQKARY